MFEFLAPIFAVTGAIAASVPIVLHMLRRTPAQRAPFSVVRFLRPTLPKVTKRSTIEHWPLMLLRILALALIALAFARPYQHRSVKAADAEDVSARRIAILIDSSASMRRDGIRDAVIRTVDRVVETLQDQDVVSLAVFDRSARMVVSADEWTAAEPSVRKSLIAAALDAWEPAWFETHTGAALLWAADDAAQERRGAVQPTERRVILITDFQRGSDLSELTTSAFPATVGVELQVVEPTKTGNTGVHLADEQSDGRIRVRVISSADAQTGEFRLQPFSESGAPIGTPIAVAIAPGQRRSVLLPSADESELALVAGVELLDDPHPFDNVVDVPVTDVPVLRIAHVGSSDANDPASMKYYLQRVIDGADQEPMQLIDVVQSDGIVVPVPEDVYLVCVTQPVPPGLEDSIRACLERGGMVFVAAASPEVIASVSPLMPEPITATEATVRDYAMLGQIDFGHPLFLSLSDARFSDLSSIRFWKHRLLVPDPASTGWKVVAKFDSGAPAILEHECEPAGRVLLAAAGWHPDDSQWALSTRFPPMVSGLIRMAHPRKAHQLTYTVGDRIDPAALTGTADWTLTDSGGHEISLPEADAAAPDQPTDLELTEPGRYLLTGRRPGEESESWSVIVGLPPAESRTEALPLGQLQALGLQATATSVSAEGAEVPQTDKDDVISAEQLRASELESKQKLWRWCLLAGLAFLALEAILAARTERRETGMSLEPASGGS